MIDFFHIRWRNAFKDAGIMMLVILVLAIASIIVTNVSS